MNLDAIDGLLETARNLTASPDYCLRCDLLTPKMYAIKKCGHVYCARCVKEIKRCLKCNKKFNKKELCYADITKNVCEHIDIFQKEIEKLRLVMNLENKKPSLNSNTSLAAVSDTFYVDFEDNYYLFEHDNCDCMNYCGIHFRSLCLKNEKSWINKKNSNGETYLFMACKHGKIKVAETLIMWGATINIQDYNGWTPLHKAVTSGNIPLVENLLKRGALINIAGEKYNTPLHKAVDSNNIKMAKMLIKYGADINFRNYEGRTPLQSASHKMRNLMGTIERGQLVLATPMYRKQFKFFILGSHSFKTSYPIKYLMKLIDITFADEINADVTHVIYEGRTKILPISYNLLLAIVYRVPVVTKEWIEVCATFKQMHSYTEYLIIGTYDYKFDAVNRSIISNLKMEPKLFSGCYFYIPEGENEKLFGLENQIISRDQLIRLLTVGGAKILKQMPQEFKKRHSRYPWHAVPGTTIAECCHYVVFVPKDVNIFEKDKFYDSDSIRHIPHPWIFECILHYRIIPPRLNIRYSKS